MTDLPRRATSSAFRPTAAATVAPARDPELLRTVLAGLVRGDDLEACAGELLIHADGRTECLDDPACATDPALHVGVVRCAEAGVGDCCAATA